MVEAGSNPAIEGGQTVGTFFERKIKKPFYGVHIDFSDFFFNQKIHGGKFQKIISFTLKAQN